MVSDFVFDMCQDLARKELERSSLLIEALGVKLSGKIRTTAFDEAMAIARRIRPEEGSGGTERRVRPYGRRYRPSGRRSTDC